MADFDDHLENDRADRRLELAARIGAGLVAVAAFAVGYAAFTAAAYGSSGLAAAGVSLAVLMFGFGVAGLR